MLLEGGQEVVEVLVVEELSALRKGAVDEVGSSGFIDCLFGRVKATVVVGSLVASGGEARFGCSNSIYIWRLFVFGSFCCAGTVPVWFTGYVPVWFTGYVPGYIPG